jgi:hypothetical protein
MVMVLPADIQDRDGAKQLLSAFFRQAKANASQTHLGRWRLVYEEFRREYSSTLK